MMKNRDKSISAVQSFRNAHSMVLRETARLDRMLTNLRFEGKSSLGRNVKQIQTVIDFFKADLMKHMEVEEKSLFPYLKAHIPKLELIIDLLCSEHRDFKKSLESFEDALNALSKEDIHLGRTKAIEKLREKGVYITYLLRHHVEAEEESVYKAINHDLRLEERMELQKLAS